LTQIDITLHVKNVIEIDASFRLLLQNV